MDFPYFSNPTPQYPFNSAANTYGEAPPHGNDNAQSPLNGYDPSYQYAPSHYMPPQVPQQLQSPPQSNSEPIQQYDQSNLVDGARKTEYDNGDLGGHRSSSDEKESMTPAQTRRKAQNRAAQRAFRERKEKHVKDLESKLHSLDAHSSSLVSDNERLRRELQRLATQNEILIATAQTLAPPRDLSPISGPQTFSPKDFVTAVGEDASRPFSYAAVADEQGRRLLGTGAAWDLIRTHERCTRGRVNLEEMCDRLRGRAQCNGAGPAFYEQDLLRAIEESSMTSNDELI